MTAMTPAATPGLYLRSPGVGGMAVDDDRGHAHAGLGFLSEGENTG
jgi:hypothetical protein